MLTVVVPAPQLGDVAWAVHFVICTEVSPVVPAVIVLH